MKRRPRWKVQDYDGSLAVVMASGVDYVICEVNGRREDPEGNARLLAAAPELRDALRTLMDCSHDPPGVGAKAPCNCYRKAAAAIRLADGGPPSSPRR